MTSDDLIGSAEACQILGVTRGTLSRWVAFYGRLTPAVRLPGHRGAMLFRRADVLALRDERAETEAAS